MKFLARKVLGQLAPIDEPGAEAMRKIKHGALVEIEVKQPRNIQHHRLYFALVNLVFDNQERYETREQLHNALKLSAGIYNVLVMPNGSEHKIPGSIAFHKMDQTEFGQFYDRVCDIIAQHFLPGVTSEQIKAEVSSMIGVAA